jgi:hypothetical protein
LLDDIFWNTFTLRELSVLHSIARDNPFQISLSAQLLPVDRLSIPERFSNDKIALKPVFWRHRFHATTQRVVKETPRKILRKAA